MRIIIEHGKTKREIKGPFNICGSAQDLEFIGRQLLHYARSDEFNYGWIEIRAEEQPSISNVHPKGWDE